MNTPDAASCLHATSCPPKNTSPSTVVTPSHRRSGALVPRSAARRAASIVRLLIRRTAVVSQSTGGRKTAGQSPALRRTKYVLVNAANRIVMAPTRSHTPMRAGLTEGTALPSPEPPPPGPPPAGRPGSRGVRGSSRVGVVVGGIYTRSEESPAGSSPAPPATGTAVTGVVWGTKSSGAPGTL